MKYTLSFAALITVSTAGKVVKKQSSGMTDDQSPTPLDIPQLASHTGHLELCPTLEHLEDKFYCEGLANYT